MTRTLSDGPDTAVHVRRGLLALTVIGILGAAFELYSEHHWYGALQLVPWVSLVVLAVATGLAGGGRATRTVRGLALVVLLAAIFGVLTHVWVNYDTATLDERFADTWDGLPLLQRLWYAATKVVGPAPTLAPGMVGQSALLLALATLGHRRRAGHRASR